MDKVYDYIKGRMSVELTEVNPVAIIGRLKSDESIYHKLQTGKYRSLDEIDDLVGFKVVLLHRRDIALAQTIISGSDLQVIAPAASRVMSPTDLAHHEPKLTLQPPSEYLARNSDLFGIVAEIQFTTALQHSLDMATHDFDYKGPDYSWGRFRLVAQMRGMLELVDRILDNTESSLLLASDPPAKPREFEEAEAVLAVLRASFDAASLPSDLRRMTECVVALAASAGVSPSELHEILLRHVDLTTALSVDATSAVLGALFREKAEQIISDYGGKFCVTAELLTLCPALGDIPADRCVSLE